MVKIELLKDYLNKKKGEVVFVTRNVAHGLIEGGVGKLAKYKDKMMRSGDESPAPKKPSKSKRYKNK